MPSTRVLIVDDHPVFRQVARDVLEARGYTVVAEADGLATAVQAVGRSCPDAVLLDVGLGGGNGVDVAWALTRVWPGLAVLLVSADASHECCERVRSCGARGFVAKPRLLAANL